MKLQEILKDVKVTSSHLPPQTEVKDLVFDSRKVSPGKLFFAVPGFTQDGAKYVPAAFQLGAVACVVETLANIAPEYQERCIVVDGVRKALAQASANFFGRPSERMKIVGVTGTKGKTSTTFLLESIFAAAGYKTALLGTVECRYPGKSFHSERTTMESYDLQKFLREALDHGAEVAVLEVSSHALSLDRVWACAFDGVLFTNLSEDHLDFYQTMEKYYEAKRELFTTYAIEKNGKLPVMASNLEDPYGKRLLGDARANIFSFGEKNADYRATDLSSTAEGTKFQAIFKNGETLAIQSSLSGRFNFSNILGAVTLAHAMGVPKEAIAAGVKNLAVVSGRLERVETKLPFQVFVDFAHQGQALENVLSSLRPIAKNRVLLVIGAGGDRDPMRRVQLGKVAARLADFTVITSDNPRTEDPLKIIATLEANYQEELLRHPALKGKRDYVIEADRHLAIRHALRMAQPGDVVCLAGKGHETGQIIGTQEFPFDDREEAQKILREIEVDSGRET